MVLRRERLHTDKNSLQIPDGQLLQGVQNNLALAQEHEQEQSALLQQLQADLPELESRRDALQQELHTERSKESDLQAREQALRALQERIQAGGKLRPWLEKQGLGNLQALWQKLHIEPGWERALEAALRERMQALEVSQIERERCNCSLYVCMHV